MGTLVMDGHSLEDDASYEQALHERVPHVNDRVRLRSGVPGTALSRGQVGVVCSTWAGCNKPTFEVEFISATGDSSHDDVSRRLLTIEQIEIEP